MKRTFLFALCCLWAVYSNAQSELTGMVTNENGKPLVGASVVLLKTGMGTFTNEQGSYHFDYLPAGTYQLLFSYVGYETTEALAVIAENTKTTKFDFVLSERAALLDELIVKATRAGDKSPFTYVNLDKEDLENRNLGQDIPFLLDATPSVVVNSDAGAGIGYTGLRIRGIDPTRINVTINGIPLNDGESQGVFWVDLPEFVSSTNDIQVQRGVGTSTNGAGAFGASINLNTSKLNPEPYGEVSASMGSFGTRRATTSFGSGMLGGKSPQTGFTLDGRLSKITSDGYIDRAEVDMEAFYISAAYFAKRSSLRFNIFSGNEVTYQAWNGVPAQWADEEEGRTYNVSGTEKSEEDPHDNEVDDYTQKHFQLLFTHKLKPNWNLNLAAHLTRGFGFFEQYKAGESPGRYLLPDQDCDDCESDYIRRRWLDNDFYGATWSLERTNFNSSFQHTFGGAWNRYEGDHFGEIIWGELMQGAELGHRYYFGLGDKKDFNVFSKTIYSITPYLHGFLDLQFRRVDYTISGNDNDLRETKVDLAYNFFNPKAGLLYDFDNKNRVYISFAVANREPNRSDFTDAAPGTIPKPERLYNTELGLSIRKNASVFGVNIYHMAYQDQLVLTGNINDVGGAVRVNVPESYRLGLELSANVPIGRKLSLEANATLSQNKIKNFTEYIDNWDTGGQESFDHGTTDIAFSPMLIAFGRLNFKPWDGLTVALSVKHVGDQFIDNTSNENTVLDAYTLGDLHLRWQLKPEFVEQFTFKLLINNLFDTRYSANAWTYRYISEGYDGREYDPYTRLEGGATYNLTGFYPQAGRNFLLGVTVRF